MAKKKIVVDTVAERSAGETHRLQRANRTCLEAIEEEIKNCEANLARCHESKAVAIRLGIANVKMEEIDKLRIYAF